MDKLKNFPTFNFASLNECSERREILFKQFERYGIKKYNMLLTDRFDDCGYSVYGKAISSINSGEAGTIVSYVKNMKHWLENTDEEYGIFGEDDLNLCTVDNWNFTWDDFVNNLPDNWQAVQLIRLNDWRLGHQENGNPIKIRIRNWNDWGSTFLGKRSYVEQLVKEYYINDTMFRLEVKGEPNVSPHPENLFYEGFNRWNVYSCPILVENVSIPSTYIELYNKIGFDNYDKEHNMKMDQYNSSMYYQNAWKETGSTLNIKDIVSL